MSDGLDGKDQGPTRRHEVRRQPTERMDAGAAPTSPAPASRTRRAPDPARSKLLYGGAIGLAAAVLVAVGLAALFDISFWAALGITALIGLGLVVLLAGLVG